MPASKLLYTFENEKGFHKVLEIGTKSEDNIYYLIFDVVSEGDDYGNELAGSLLDIQSIIDYFQITRNKLPIEKGTMMKRIPLKLIQVN